MSAYGIDIQTLDSFIASPILREFEGGEKTVLFSEPTFRLERIDFRAPASLETDDFETTVWVEKGSLTVNNDPLGLHEALTIPPKTPWSVKTSAPATIYLFSGPTSPSSTFFKKSGPFDHRDKYWGVIESIVSKEYAGKRIVKNKGAHASLEYHCKKIEGYYVHSGKLLLRLRAGRAEDRYFELTAGMTALIPPGLMHQRGGLEDTIIIEISTRDDDSDSFLVEDGQKFPMPRLVAINSIQHKGKRICFDIDGVLRTQTQGDYQNAKPIPEAISLVNRLYDEGCWITLYTSSFMGRNKNDQRAAYMDGYEFNRGQLASWGIKYHELFMGKPPTDILIDDRAIFFSGNWKTIEQEIRRTLS